jgi:TPR repeat protein
MLYFNRAYFALFLLFLFSSGPSHSGPDKAWAAMQRGDDATALNEYRPMAESGDPIARAQLSFLLFFGYGTSINIEEAQRHAQIAHPKLEKLALEGDSRAQSVLGSLYRDGRGITKDEQTAMLWYRKAAEQGNASAMLNIAKMYLDGIGMPKNNQLFVTWLRMAAEQGHARAQSALGVSYLKGEVIAKDMQLAVAWFRKSAEQGDAFGQKNLAFMYAGGLGLTKDEQQAAVLLRMAAAQGDPEAQENLGSLYATGRGVPKDEQQAAVWFRMAAMQGNAKSQNNLGFSYSIGRGVPKDDQQAYFWWLLASAQGNPQAVGNRDAAEKRLTREQIASAQAHARSWKPGMAGITESTPQPFAERSTPSAPPAPRVSASTTPVSTGSGFAVAPNQLITNAHVVEGCARVSLGGQGSATVLAMDRRNDLALLQTDRLPVVASFRMERLRQGDPITVVGFPLAGLLASGAQVTSGNVSALAGLQNNSSFIQISAPVQPGNSGGPLLDTAGRVTGVVVSKLNAAKIAELTGDIPQNVNFAVSPLVLRGFLNANNVQYQAESTNKTSSIADVTDLARKFTYLVQCWK